MASTFKVAFEFSVLDPNDRLLRVFGDRFTRITITPTLGVLFDSLDIIADDTTDETLWVTGQGGIDTFEYLFFLSDVDIYIELANVDTSPDERLLLFVKGGIPLMLPSGVMGGFASDTSRLDGNVLVSGTDYDNITLIRVQNDAAEGAGDAKVRLLLLG